MALKTSTYGARSLVWGHLKVWPHFLWIGNLDQTFMNSFTYLTTILLNQKISEKTFPCFVKFM